MKIEINLEGIFEENGTLTEGVKSQIIDEVAQMISDQAECKMGRVIQENLEKICKEKMTKALDKVIPEIMDYEFTETTSWGEKKGTYKVRSRLIKYIEEISKYNGNINSYDQNAYTKIVRATVDEKMNSFKKDFNTQVDQMFTQEAMAYAQKKLQERLNIK